MMILRKTILLLLLSLFSIWGSAQFLRNGKSLTIQGQYKEEAPKAGFGLEKVFIIEDLSQAVLTYTTSSDVRPLFYVYTSNLSEKRLLESNQIEELGKSFRLRGLKDGEVLVVDDAGQMICFALIDYRQHTPIINSISAIEAEDKCEFLKIVVDKKDTPLEYRGNGGQLGRIDRIYEVSYTVKEWNNEEKEFKSVEKLDVLRGLGNEFILGTTPTMDTYLSIGGDQYAKAFNKLVTYKTPEPYKAVRVEAHVVANQRSAIEGENQQVLGGSAPVDIEFLGKANQPTTEFFTWFIYDKKDLNNFEARYTDQDIDYQFNRYGEFIVALEVASQNSICIDTAKVVVNVSESMLDIPNFFSPKNKTGANTKFKVRYKSLVKYNCAIFNRWGNKVYESNNPEEGWDGKYKGSYVNPGVYFYSIEATGAEGKKYKKGGDINILY